MYIELMDWLISWEFSFFCFSACLRCFLYLKWIWMTLAAECRVPITAASEAFCLNLHLYNATSSCTLLIYSVRWGDSEIFFFYFYLNFCYYYFSGITYAYSENVCVLILIDWAFLCRWGTILTLSGMFLSWTETLFLLLSEYKT